MLSLLNQYTVWFGNFNGDIPKHSLEHHEELEKGRPINLRAFLEKLNFSGGIRIGDRLRTFQKKKNAIFTDFLMENKKFSYSEHFDRPI